MESECNDILCFAFLFCLSHPPNLPGCSVSEDVNRCALRVT